jgi:hypothetical protein
MLKFKLESRNNALSLGIRTSEGLPETHFIPYYFLVHEV